MLSELRFGFRQLRKNTAESVLMVLIIAAATGANTAVFSVVNSIYFYQLPFRDADHLVRLQDFSRTPEGTENIYNTWGSHFNAITRQSSELACTAAMDDDSLTMSTPEGAVKVALIVQSPGTLDCLGVQPALGRGFTKTEEAAGRQSGVLLVSSAFAQRQFGTAANALNKVVELSGQPLQIVGVMPPGYRFPYEADAWTPMVISDAVQRDFAVFGRLKPESSLVRLKPELDVIAQRIRSDIPGTRPGYGISARSLRETLIRETVGRGEANITLTLFGLVSFFLVMACASVGHLLLARITVRAREFAVRRMLGASIARLARQVMIETLVLASLGSIFGLFLALGSTNFLAAIVPKTLRNEFYAGAVALDWRIVIFNIATALVVALLCAGFPILQLKHSELVLRANASPRGASMAAGQQRTLAAFVIAETALGFALFAAANGMNAHFNRLTHPQLGFDPDSLLTFQVSLAGENYAAPEKRIQVVHEAVRLLREVSGVSAAAVTTLNPLSGSTWGASVRPQGAPRDAASILTVNHRLVSPGLLETMKIALLRGRTIAATDTATSPPVVVISKHMARQLFGDQDPIGKRIEWVGRNRPVVTVVGVVEDVKDYGQMSETWYVPYYQQPAQDDAMGLCFMLRSKGSPESVMPYVQKVFRNIDPGLAIYEVATMTAFYNATIAQNRVGNLASTVFACLGLALFAMGTYGVLSFVVNANMRGYAIRSALGAPSASISAHVFRRGLAYVVTGIVIGLALIQIESAIGRRLISELQISTPSSYLIGITVLLAIALLACYVPARRAVAGDLLAVLRAE